MILFDFFLIICDGDGYGSSKRQYNIILTGFILSSKDVFINVWEAMIKDKEQLNTVLMNKGNCKDLFFMNMFLKLYGKKPTYVKGKFIELDRSNGFHAGADHIRLRNEFCKKFYNYTLAQK
tara:strand:- start:152 stop:514 length:363 start_codon:yes stop_codon:yes gene_type:complete